MSENKIFSFFISDMYFIAVYNKFIYIAFIYDFQ